MISYAQNGEDVLLARVFRDQPQGFYVDIGAGHPTYESVTKHFYDQGWCGINVEPMTAEFELLCHERPRDLNIRAAVTDARGEVVLFEGPDNNRGASTIESTVADRYEQQGQMFAPVTVPALTPADVFDQVGDRTIDFVKIDVEGHETVVVSGVDWTQIHPRVVIVEATHPNSQTPSHQSWEPALSNAGYTCAFFDGLNRFYVQAADEYALNALSVPVNVFDGAEPWRWVSELQGAKAYIAELERENVEGERVRREMQAQARALEPWLANPLSRALRTVGRTLRRRKDGRAAE